ncbi:MAG: type II toxin-antitoxin system VapC family toxin [Propionibacteriaceae bacterium]|jgi:predicted nucleic acid-binding protein|nr:type II toxin-antitoxin system VapC family toxin [Propionibacteriaceae bacterium]
MYLLDTNVISELRKLPSGRCNPAVEAWLGSVPDAELYVASVTLFELEKGALLAKRRDPKRAASLDAWVRWVHRRFSGKLLSFDTRSAAAAAPFHVPDPAPVEDSFIAATAKVHNLTVATRSTKDFARFSVPYFNPWEYLPDQPGQN